MLTEILKKYKLLFSKAFVLLAFGIMCSFGVSAADEPYLNELKGNKVAVDSAFTVADEKFIDASAWSLIDQNISVDNLISFEIDFDSTIYFYGEPFDCTVNFKVYIYGNQSDTSEITDSVTHSNISLQVRYDTTTGGRYKGVAIYKFAGAHKYRVKILTINSPQLDPLPAIFRLKGQIIVKRQYLFEDASSDVTRYSIMNGNQLKLEWTPFNYPGAEEFDLEYTHIDGASSIANSIRGYATGGDYFIPEDSLTKWFLNNSTRITTPASEHLLNIAYDSGFILFRIRGVQMHYPDGIRWEGNWNYLARLVSESCSTCPSGAVFFDPHEENLNWQYTASFAEEGKRKEVITYFDGALRNRQSVTINNSDNKNVVQEPIYDVLGRPSINILPAPVDDSTIHYFRGFNKNSSGDPYSFADLLYGSDCRITADSISYTSGAGRYYSSNNQFINYYYYARYIPDGGGYPLATTEYIGDNTGRIRSQGGVGPAFQLKTGHETRYFYGKPSQTELDRLFGTEAGNFSHYLKNMVVDPNGQISVSYLDPSGKVIASALAGAFPENLHALPSTEGASTLVTDELMQPNDFLRDASDYSITSSSTFLAPVTGDYVINYKVDPLKMEKLYGPDKDSLICNNCYYDLEVTVKDDCANVISQELRPAGNVFDTACATPPDPITDSMTVEIAAIGEYYVTFRLVISRDALDFFDSTHLVKNSDIRKLNYFLQEELKNTDFTGCYTDCETCFDALGTKEEFSAHFRLMYVSDSVTFAETDSLWVLSLYDSLIVHCQSIQTQCAGNVCDEKLEILLRDVSPGGQYALYDSSANLIETEINIIAKRNQIVRFTDEFGNRDSVTLYDINGDDSITLDVKELSDAQFIANWKDVWADSLVRLHPEYCYYLWCVANSDSYFFDREIGNWQDADTAVAKGWFSFNDYDVIVDQDPFFLEGGNGFTLRNKMRRDLELFSRTMVRTSAPDRNMLQFVDLVLYCAGQADGWETCSPDSACRSRNREWFLYQQLYLNLKQKYYEEARRTSSNPVFANCVNCYVGKDLLQYSGADTAIQSPDRVPFTDSTTCNFNCAEGAYNPFDKTGISLFIQYGAPATSPTGVPSGYGDCRYYNVYNLKTGANTSCRFFNVWVCTYDSTCGGVCDVVSYPSHCPEDPNAALYENKFRRYPEYVNTDEFIDGVLSSNLQEKVNDYAETVQEECSTNCEAQADVWIAGLNKCTTDTVKLAELKQALIDICSAGCSTERIFGASTLPPTISATYHSFEEAIIAIIGPTAISDSCTAELLSDPYPFDKQPVFAERVIQKTDYEICQKISQYKVAYQTSGFGGSMHAYLVKTLGSTYFLDSVDLDDLMNSCVNCNGILKNDIVLPAFFEPNSSACILCDSVQNVYTAFAAKYQGIDSTNDNYRTLFANFFNHKLGYSLSYDEYGDFIDSCSLNPEYAVNLCNKPATREGTVDVTGNACVEELFATALTNANNTYIAYIDSVRQDFRDAYLTQCMNVQASLTMTAELFEYHYTLYYYDQSGSLVKTIPPEGVTLLDGEGLADVKRFRSLQSTGCYQNSDSVRFNNNGQVVWNGVSSFEGSPWTTEFMINPEAHSDQVLFSKLTEHAFDTGTGPNYRYTGLLVELQSNKFAISAYGIGGDSSQKQAIALSARNVSAILPLNTWRHVVIERTLDTLNPLRMWVNGNPVALQYSANDLDSAEVLIGNAPLILGAHAAANLAMSDKLIGTIKNLRVYKRLLSSSEIRQNAYNNCQTPVNQNGLVFWSPLNSADSNIVVDLIARRQGVLTGFDWEPFNGVFPEHRLPTVYQYNSLGQVVQQFTPDADTSAFWYDRLGRLIVSQNKEQKVNASYSGTINRFSYTKYDALGRIREVGEKSDPLDDIRDINLLDTNAVKTWTASGTDRQVTKTLYDNPIDIVFQSSTTSRKRVVASILLENGSDEEGDSTLYSYDILGNVKSLQQYVKSLVAADPDNGKKQIDYDYDLASGKVNMISYQAGKGDQFFYKYSYDADNRVTRSLSSRDKLIWTEDASYIYYLHGPLARMELGQLKVQGVDYAYTLQGWLKGINGDVLDPEKEMGTDGFAGSMFSRVSRDVYSMKLGYYSDDYQSIGGTDAGAFAQRGYTAPGSSAASGNQLFNGNISFSTLALSKLNSGGTTGYSYGYDQLNRLVNMRQHTATGGWSNSNIITAYSESIAYDANGNILKYLRNGANAGGMPLNMDSLNYKYNRDVEGRLVNNKLNYVSDEVGASNYDVDIDSQSPDNYAYDNIGNLVSDAAEGLDEVRWTVYGKINQISKSSGAVIGYGYDPGGNRTFKQYQSNDTLTSTYYVRDAQGNVLAVYEKMNAEELKWSEQHLYGSSRLGMWKSDTIISLAPPVVLEDNPVYDSLQFGSRLYELSNHLGNVLSVISDKKIGNDSSGVVNYYLAEVLSQNDYYPFGMGMVGRKFSTSAYRYGFNGKENDDEVEGTGNQQDYGERVYDPRVGRFLSVDPIASAYAWNSTYAYAENEPISNIDLDGLEKAKSNNAFTIMGQGLKQGWRETKELWRNAFSRKTASEIKATANDVLGTVKGDPNSIRSFNKRMFNFSMGISNTLQNYTTQPAMWTMTIPTRSRDENLMGLGYGMWKGFELYTFSKAPEILGATEADFLFTKLSNKSFNAFEGNNIISNALNNGARLVVVGGEEAALMKALNKQAGLRWMGNGAADIQITRNASRATIMEEAIHYEQYMKYGEDFMMGNTDLMEIEAKDQLLRIGKNEGWSAEEMNRIRAERGAHQKALNRKR